MEPYRKGTLAPPRLAPEDYKTEHDLVELFALAHEQGIVTTKEAGARWIPRLHLSTLVEAGYLERVGRGVYRFALWPWSTAERLDAAVALRPGGVFGLLTAAYLHGLLAHEPPAVWLCLEAGRRVPWVEGFALEVVHARGGVPEGDVEVVEAPEAPQARTGLEAQKAHEAWKAHAAHEGPTAPIGRSGPARPPRTTRRGPRTVRAYRVTSRARTVVDLFRFRRRVPEELAVEAIRAYLEQGHDRAALERTASQHRARTLLSPHLRRYTT